WLMFLDDVGFGTHITEKLRGEGHVVITVREGDSFNKRGEFDYVISPERGRTDYDALIKDLVSTGHMPSRIAHLWMLTAKETFRPGSSFFHRNQERGFYSLLFLAQALGDESLPEPIQIKVFSNGFQQVHEEAVPYPEKASLLGPVKVIPHEYPNIHVSSIDLELPALKRKRFGGESLDHQDFALVLEEIENELKVGGEDEIIALRQHKRWVQNYEQAEPEALPNLQSRIKTGGTYLITGGLGGLGLLMAGYLADHYKANLILLGRSNFPDESDWDSFIKLNGEEHRTSLKIAQLRDIIRRGGSVIVANADVSDTDAIRVAVEKGVKRFGSINGVIHTAGVLKDDLIQMKRQADVEDVFTPKIHGTLILDEVLKDIPLDFFVLFSSTSSVIAAAGQVDYVAANAFLNAYAHARKHLTDRFTVAINWGVWNQVGMAADSIAGIKAQAERQPATHPLYQSRISDDRANLVLEAEYSPENYWILNEHRTGNGYALIPGTGYIEMARAALRENGELRNFAIEDLIFFRPLYVADNSKKKIRVKLVPKTDGYDYIVQSQVDLPDGRSGWELHAQAKLTPCAAPAELSISVKEVQARCKKYVSPVNPGGIRTGQEEHLQFGPRWRVLHQYAVGEGEAIAELALPDAYADDLKFYGIHPALLDLATGYAMDLIEGYDSKQGLWVPLSYKRISMYGKLPKRVYSWIRGEELKASNEIAQFDVIITDENGNILLEIEQFVIRKLAPNFQFGIAPTSMSSELEFDQNEERAAEKQLSPAELAFRHSLKQGILPEEGTKALDKVLASVVQSEVIVSSMDLQALRQQASTVVKEEKSTDSSKFARPNLESEYVEARDDIERTLVSFWEELLGVNQVGVRDSFIDLGGHSLIAVRLFAKIKKAWHVEYPISVLFEAPTIEQCANMIRDVIGANAATPVGETAEPGERKIEKKVVRHTHLVAMHQG
ncbi:MAG TPA: KR domain-containing protein, partial [Pseudomonadales bacterium]|nr:KR domain-containing protein [Pseudomonadales bacterium]